MTEQCTGCGRLAEKYCKHNEEICLCIPCTKLLPWPGLELRDLAGIGGKTCMCCEVSLYHGQDVCQSCVSWIMTYVGRLDPELLNDNPFIYELELPLIRFIQSMSPQNAHDYGEDAVRFYLDGELTTVSFARLIQTYTLFP